MSVKGQIVTRRTDRAGLGEPALINELRDLHQPIAGNVPLAQVVNPMVREGELYSELPNDVVHCFACAHECKIKPGGRGICQVRYNLGGKLHVPWGKVQLGTQADLFFRVPRPAR